MKRARPTEAVGGTPTKDHLFGTDNRSLCGNWLYNGGRTVYPDRDGHDDLIQAVEDGELCTECAREAGVPV